MENLNCELGKNQKINLSKELMPQEQIIAKFICLEVTIDTHSYVSEVTGFLRFWCRTGMSLFYGPILSWIICIPSKQFCYVS